MTTGSDTSKAGPSRRTVLAAGAAGGAGALIAPASVMMAAEGAAMATQTKAEFDVFFGVSDLLPNATLINGIHAHMIAVGLDWSEGEQAFARTCQAEMGLPEKGMATKVMPVLGEITTGGGSDVGDVSWVVPTVLFGWPSLPLGVSLHTWPVHCSANSACTSSPLYRACAPACWYPAC